MRSHKFGILATFVLVFLFSGSAMGQNSKITPIFNITKTTSGQHVDLSLSVLNVNAAAAQQIKQGDTFLFAIDPATASGFESQSDVEVRSSSLSPSDFSASFNTATGEIKITYIGNDKVFSAGDSFGVELSFNDQAKAVAGSVKAKGVIAAG